MLKFLVVVMMCVGACAFAQKLHVKVLEHSVDGRPFSRVVPGFGMNNGNANANCAAYGKTANCSVNSSGSSMFLPAHTVDGVVAHIQMLLLLPDGRRVEVICDDHFWGLTQAHQHHCKNPEVEEFEGDFSGEKVKLKWSVGIGGNKTDSETYRVGKVYPAPTPEGKQ